MLSDQLLQAGGQEASQGTAYQDSRRGVHCLRGLSVGGVRLGGFVSLALAIPVATVRFAVAILWHEGSRCVSVTAYEEVLSRCL